MSERSGSGAGHEGIVRALLLVAGGVLVTAALLYNRATLSPLAEDAFRPLTLEKIRGVQLLFAALGGVFLLGAAGVARAPRLARGRAAEWLLLGLVGLLPIGLIDFGLRPFVEPLTRIFVEDRELGWRMRPGAADEWGGVRVRVNERGLRGPALAPGKSPGTRRILFLGDSVTFGYGVADEDDLFVQRVGESLSQDLGVPVETLNAGVGGYAPWQERIWLEREGLDYAPDLVVVGFVLNDVTEPLSLVRYGGSGRGWQLARSAGSALERWASGSALVTLARRGTAELRFGPDVQLGAARVEAADVQRLALAPESPVLQRGWAIALASLDDLLDLAAAHDVPSLVVIFPFRFQLDAPQRYGDPQRRLGDHLRARGTPVLDLLPRFAAHPEPRALMLDPSHLSVEGHALAARAIDERVRDGGWLTGGAD